jgi:elongation factor G
MAVEVETPEDYAGNVMGDLSSRRGIVQGMDDHGWWHQADQGRSAAVGNVRLLDQLRSLSQGRATYSMEFKHYTEAPRKNVAEAVINKK